MANKWKALLIICILVPFLPLASGQPQPRQESAGIWQLIEERNGRVSCRGVVIELAHLSFPLALDPSAIEITEGKHNRSLKDLMEWKIDPTRKRLTIQFRPGKGDFGTGNKVEVRIKREVLEPHSHGTLTCVIETDPL